MAQFETPQFIGREAKVIGPLTFKRAVYLGIPLIGIFIMWFVIGTTNFLMFVVLSVLAEGTGFVLGFVEIEGKTVPELIENAFVFLFKPKTYVWRRENTPATFHKTEYVNPRTGGASLPKDSLVRTSRVSDLSVRVQTKA
jgi:hypothetical protein